MKKISFDELVQTVKELADKRVLLTFHSVGDSDAVSSAFGLKLILKNATIATPDTVTANSRRILQSFGFNADLITDKFDDSAEAIVLLDVNNFEDCGRFGPKLQDFKGKILVIDHHAQSQIGKEEVYAYNEEGRSATACIIYAVLGKLGIKPDQGMAKLLAAGIVSDSAEFRNADGMTFVQIGELLTIAKIDYPALAATITHISDPKAPRHSPCLPLSSRACRVSQRWEHR